MLNVGVKAPEFKLPDQNGVEHSLSEYKGKKVILYFYPKDNTSGCTLEAIQFSELKDEFEKLNAVVIGVSKDSVASHKKFIEKHNLTVELVSDEDISIQEHFDVWKLKKMCGKEYMGTVRSTFILDDKGNILKEFRNVKAKDHAIKVLEALKEL